MEGGCFRGAGSHHHGVVQGAALAQHFHHVGHRGGLLAHGHVNANHVLTLLVEDRVDGDSGLAGLAVADDQLPLAATDGDHRVDGGDAGLHRLMHRLALDDARRHRLDQASLAGFDISLAVDGLAQGIHHPTEQGITHGHGGDLAGGLDGAALLNAPALTHQHHADVVVLEVEGDAFGAVFELHQLTGHHLLQAIDPGDAVADLQHGADIANRYRLVVIGDLLLKDRADLVGADGNHGWISPKGVIWWRRVGGWALVASSPWSALGRGAAPGRPGWRRSLGSPGRRQNRRLARDSPGG